MVAASFCELGAKWRSLAHGITGLFSETTGGFSKAAQRLKRRANVRRGSSSIALTRVNSEDNTVKAFDKREIAFGEGMVHQSRGSYDDEEPDPALPHERVPALWWGTGLLASVIFTTT